MDLKRLIRNCQIFRTDQILQQESMRKTYFISDRRSGGFNGIAR